MDVVSDLSASMNALALNCGDGGYFAAENIVAGAQEALQALRELIVWPKKYRKEGASIGVEWARGVLLYGPPGCGKTLLVKAVCKEAGAVVHTVMSGDVFGSFVGESEKRLRQVFEQAAEDASNGKTAVIFMDEIDSLCPKRSPQKPHETRVVSQLLTLMDGLASPDMALSQNPNSENSAAQNDSVNEGGVGHVVVVGATNRPNDLDPALRRPGRFDRELSISVPDASQRHAILRLQTCSMPLGLDVRLEDLAGSCHGYSGSDLAAVCREAAMHAMTSATENAQPNTQPNPGSLPQVNLAHFQAALSVVPPSIGRGYEQDTSPVHWSDIGGLHDVKKRLQQAVEWPLKHRDAFTRLGLQPAKGVLMYGPPGCCKTTLARALATGCGARLLALSCAQVFSMYVGEGESIVRETFRRARLSAPSIVLLDEVDAIAGRRSSGSNSGPHFGARLLSTILTEMDGLELSTGLLVVAATNRPEILDPAFVRPGRLDVLLYVPPPDRDGRLQTLVIHSKCMPLAGDVDLEVLADQTELYTGAELAGVCREAALCALREDIDGAETVTQQHFLTAKEAIRPSLTQAQLSKYEEWGSRWNRHR